jgi:hypothetical protein
MPRIDRPDVRPNLATVSDLRLAGLRVGSPFASMTVPTQALQRAQQEAIPVAVMRLDVIGDRGGDDMSLLAAARSRWRRRRRTALSGRAADTAVRGA